MTTRKIKELDSWDTTICRNPNHNPPGMMVYQPGLWEHTCPSCKRSFTFIVRPNHLVDMGGKIWKGTKDTVKNIRVRWGI